MVNKFFAIFFIFCVAANANVAVLHTRQSNIAYTEKISSNISIFTECKRYGVNDENGLLRVAASNPEIFVILDVSTAQNYAKLVRDGQNLAPHITICDAPLNEEDALLLAKHGIVCFLSASPVWLMQGLTNNAIDVRNVGFIYGGDAKFIAQSEILQLRAEGFSVFNKFLDGDILPDKFARLAGNFFENDVSIYRFCGNDPILPFFNQEPSMVSFVGQRAAAVIVDSPELAGMFRRFGAVMLKTDDALVERISTFIVLAALFDSDFGTPRFSRPIKIYCKNAVLYDKNNPYGKNIIAFDSIFSQLDKVQDELQKVGQTADAFWELYANLLGNVIDTAAFSQKNLNFTFWGNEIVAFFERTFAITGFETVYIFIPIVIFAIMLVCGFMFFRIRKSGVRSSVSHSQGSYISGIIQEDNLAAVFQMIDGNRHTGCLSVDGGKRVFAIYFKSGRAVYADDNSGKSTIETIYAALDCPKGNFYFHLNKTSTDETFNYGADEILMGWAQRRDERSER